MTRNFDMDSISAVGLMLLLHGILDWDTGLSCDKWEHVISLNACNLFTYFQKYDLKNSQETNWPFRDIS